MRAAARETVAILGGFLKTETVTGVPDLPARTGAGRVVTPLPAVYSEK